MNRRVLAIVAALFLMSSIMMSGCVAVVAGAAGGAGAYQWVSGKLTFATSQTIGECHEATLAAFKELGITVVSDNTDKLSGKIKGTTQLGKAVTIDLEPQGMKITNIDIRIGFWGDRGQSTKVADTIKTHL